MSERMRAFTQEVSKNLTLYDFLGKNVTSQGYTGFDILQALGDPNTDLQSKELLLGVRKKIEDKDILESLDNVCLKVGIILI